MSPILLSAEFTIASQSHGVSQSAEIMKEHSVFEFFPRLSEEISILEHLLKSQPSECLLRLYVRSCFAMLEALSCLIRDKASQGIVGKFKTSGHLEITKAHYLEDYSYKITSTGKIERQNRCDISFGAHFAFGLRTLAEVAEVNKNYIEGAGWDAFQNAIRIRNRITHPKTDTDVTISDNDFGLVKSALNWAFDSLVDICRTSTILVDPNDDMPPEIHD